MDRTLYRHRVHVRPLSGSESPGASEVFVSVSLARVRRRGWLASCYHVAAAVLVLCAAGASAQDLVPPRLEPDQSLQLARPASLDRELSGEIVCEIEVGQLGHVDAARVVELRLMPETTDPALVIEAALEHVRGLRFQPARRPVEPIAVRMRVLLTLAPPHDEQAASPVAEVTPELPASARPRPTTPEPPPPVPPPPVPPPMAADHAEAQLGQTTGQTTGQTAGFTARAHLHAATGSAPAAAASDMNIELGALRDVPRPDAQSYLTLSPGVVLANHSGIGHTSGVYLRGFDAGEGQDIEVSVDGVPINEPSNAHEHGYADTQFVIPETVQRVRVQQGSFDPRQSDFAVAGSVAYGLGVNERGLRLQLGYGRFSEQRALLLWAPSDATSGTFTALDLRRGDGFGPNRAHQSISALARYARAAGPLHYALLIGSHAQQFDSAGVIREDSYEARALPCARDATSQFFCMQDPQQGGSTYRHLLSGKLSWARPNRRYELQAYGMLRGLRIRENFTGALLDARGDGVDESYAVTTFGALSSYTLTPTFWRQRQRLELGFEARHDAGDTRMWRVRRDTSIPYAAVFDRQLALTHIAGYVRAELSPLPWLSLRGGARFDGFAFHTEDQLAPDSDRVGPRLPQDARDAWGNALSPRGSLVLHAARGLDWTMSAGLGVRSSDAAALSEGEQAPFARVLALETGPSWQARFTQLAVEARAFAFATRVSQDLLFDPASGRNVPVGPSNRYGAAFSARARVSNAHDTLASFTWADARAIERTTSILAWGDGTPLPFVPRTVLRVDHASRGQLRLAGQELQLSAAGGLSWVGARPLPLGASSDSTWQLDLSARVRVRFLELGVSLENVFDVRNRVSQLYYASDFSRDEGSAVSMRPVRHFAAGAPRSFWLTLTIHLDDLEIS